MSAASQMREYVATRGAALYRGALLLTGNPQDAEDLVQETYVVMIRQWRRIEATNPDPYVRRIMYSRFVDGWRRRRRRLPEFPTAEPLAEPLARHTELDPASTSDDRLVLRAALLQLTPRQRAFLVLRFYDDLTEAETAQVLGVSTNTVKSQTRIALQRLRDLAPAAVGSFAPPTEEAVP